MPISQPLTPARTMPHFNTLVFPTRAVTALATAGALTYTAAQVYGGMIDRDCNAAPRTDTLPTAAALVAALPGVAVGSSFLLIVRNTTGSAQTLTIAAGAGGTAVGTMTIAQSNLKIFLVLFTNVTLGSEAYSVYSLGTLVF